jgi:hypothetical protein
VSSTSPAPSAGDTDPQDTPAAPAVPEAFQATPHAERYVLQADALRRRQLRAALLYGSSRYWRRRQRIWPAAIAGSILAAVIAGVIVAADAFRHQQDINQDRHVGLLPPEESQEPEAEPPIPGGGTTPEARTPVPVEPSPDTSS